MPQLSTHSIAPREKPSRVDDIRVLVLAAILNVLTTEALEMWAQDFSASSNPQGVPRGTSALRGSETLGQS